MKKIITLLTIFFAFGQISFGQIKENITKPGWTKARADLKKYNSKLVKQVAQYGYTSTANFKIEYKYPERPDKGTIKKYSRGAYSCYANPYNKYEDIWPEDQIMYTFKVTAPKKKNGEQYTFSVYITYSRSKFTGKKGCYGTIGNSYSFYKLSSRVLGVSGNEVSREEMNNLMFEKFDEMKIGNYTSKIKNTGIKGVVSIDSLVFVHQPNTGSSSTKQEYRMYMYNKVYESDDYIPARFYQQKKTMRVFFDKQNGVATLIKAFFIGDIEETQEFSVKDIPNYEIIRTNKNRKAIDYYQKVYEMIPPPLSKYGLMEIQSNYYPLLKFKDYDEIKDDAYLKQLFASQDDFKQFSDYFQEFKYGLWTIKEKEIKYNSYKNLSYSEAMIRIELHIDRNLTKSQRKTIKGKVSATSYKNSKYHYGGSSYITLRLKMVDGKAVIKDIDINNNSIKAIR